MKLVWKLLRRHISLPQFTGFFFANLLGMLIVLLGLQFYKDVKPIFSEEDGFIRPDFLILSKRVSTFNTLGLGSVNTFSKKEISELESQPFAKRVGAFTASQYKVSCSMGIDGVAQIGTEMFFESVPDAFVDVDLQKWHFSKGDEVVPIIVPKTYLAIYNFGFAQSQKLPQISEGIVGMVEMMISMRGNGRNEYIKGRVIGFSTRLNTILAPESFIRWSNERYAPEADVEPSRIILEVSNPADDAIVNFINEKGYEMEDDKLDAGRMTFFLRLVSGIVMMVGLLISLLSFYILMLSIYLLVEKNTEKMRTLLLIGYSPARVALPYQLLTIGMNAAVLLIATGVLCFLRTLYLQRLHAVFPQMTAGSISSAILLGVAIFVVISLANAVIIRRRINKIWNNKG
ncbi:MAG: ABC transporter permease [Bacteroidaceae bacterium]|nr:ABC transporter permease [Bacteroidaceae bacterium]